MSLLLAIGAAGPVNYTLVCSAGSYAYSGRSATLTVARNLQCASGSYAYTGQNATLNVVHSLVCSSGTYNYTGNDATLTYVPGVGAVNYALTCDAGSYSYSGNDANLSYVEGATQNSGGWYIPPQAYNRYKQLKKKEIDVLLDKEEVIQEEVRIAEKQIENGKSARQIRNLERRISGLVDDIYILRILIALTAEQEELRQEEEMMLILLLEAA